MHFPGETEPGRLADVSRGDFGFVGVLGFDSISSGYSASRKVKLRMPVRPMDCNWRRSGRK